MMAHGHGDRHASLFLRTFASVTGKLCRSVIFTAAMRRSVFLRASCKRVVSDGKSARDSGGRVFARRQLDCPHALRRAIVDETARNVCRDRAGKLAVWPG